MRRDETMRIWGETVTGLAWAPDEVTFEEALNAYLGQVYREGGEVHTPIQHTAFLGPDGQIIHSALVTYSAPAQVDYHRAIDTLVDAEDDARADMGFDEDLQDVLAGQLPVEETDEAGIS